MKIAHLILAHKNPAQLERLIGALEHPGSDFYIHLDKKTSASAFDYLVNNRNIFMIANRAKIYWAGYGTIQATLNGFREILPKGYDYINVISAQDFPLKAPDHIYEYLAARRGKEFITCESIDDQWKEAASRVRRYHLINWRIPFKYRLSDLATKLLPPRKFPLDYKIVGRANWFTLSPAAAQYMISFLEEHPEVVRYFKYCWGADEFIFATVLYNSGFRDRIVDNLVYVDWTGQTKGHPRVLVSADFEALKASDKLFARKFDMEMDPGIFSLLEQWIRPQRQNGLGQRPAEGTAQ